MFRMITCVRRELLKSLHKYAGSCTSGPFRPTTFCTPSQVRDSSEKAGMKNLSIRISVWGAVLAVFLNVNFTGQVKNQATPTPGLSGAKAARPPADIPPCSGASSGWSSGQAPSLVNPHPHSVTLSWNAAVPASNSPRDAIKGYNVYRSPTSHTYNEGNRISETPLRGTRCVDATVEPRKTYFYVVKTVTEGGEQSGSSIEIKAVVPFP
jgi:hypothetical protein